MKRIRIIYTIPNFDTAGSGIALLKLIKNLDKKKFEPIIICHHEMGMHFKLVLESKIEYHTFQYIAEQKPYYLFLIKLVKIYIFYFRLRPDIIFSYHYHPYISEPIVARLLGAKFIYIKKNMGWFGASWKQWRIKSFLSNCIVIQNITMKNIFFKDNRNIHYIPIGVDTNEFYPREKDILLQEELKIHNNDKILLCIANLVPKKGILNLLKSFSNSKCLRQTKLIIVGNNKSDLWNIISEFISTNDLVNKVIFTGIRSDIHRFYSISDLFILASTGDEGAPIVIQEAMASGVVVIASNIPGISDQMKNFSDQLFLPDDSDDISFKIDEFINIPIKLKNQIIRKQLEHVRSNYSVDTEAKRHESMYLDLYK